MLNSLKSRKNISTFTLKQYISRLLASELASCKFNIVLGFEASFKNRICKLRIVDSKNIEVFVNLEYIKKSIYTADTSHIFLTHYCVYFIAAYLKYIERTKEKIPQSYFEGLAFLNAIGVYKSKGQMGVYSPLFYWNERPKSIYCLRPLEISCAIYALNRMRLLDVSELNEHDKLLLHTLCDSFLLYAGLPEVSYNYSKVPLYAIVDSLTTLANIVTEQPILSRDIPVLSLMSFENMQKLTINDLFLHCVQSENEFLLGVSIRLIAFFRPLIRVRIDDVVHEKLVTAIKKYIDLSLSYCRESKEMERCVIKDNLYAVKIAVRSFNSYLCTDNTNLIVGNIHTIM